MTKKTSATENTEKTSANKNGTAQQQSSQYNTDKLSRQILALLQENGRRSYTSIARELGVSESAVRSRVSHLEEHEHLRFIAVIDPVHIGYKCWAVLGITVVAGSSPHELALEFSKIPQAIWVSVIGGKFDLMVEVWAESSTELQEFLEEFCYSNKNIASVDTMVGMQIYKWGAPPL
ncbi:Lrp/AsnC family transcriptional regulator [Sneathiella litorea]|uniref:AsnC family transcriptional regulator n=1 Tax=Sneathiella litorea TaxID=2606216 RepID=A0A6L8W5A9_9PROT|nr:Lrp/AsnC family transcriptional regulator [Sneathiella litorea]MZR29644.1 AsnC family transcriptional regulator [Sneathiella litorea]